MKIYDFAPAPNPTKLRVYMKEKGLEIPRQSVNLLAGEQTEAPFLAINPLGGVPVLELDDGTRISESLAIIELLEELHPEPPMIGRDPVERARVREMERIIELGVLMRIARVVHATRSPLPNVPPEPRVAEIERERLDRVLPVVDARIGDQPFVAGERPTIADCTLFAALRFGQLAAVEPGPECKNIRRWYESFSRRPSTAL